MLMAVDAHESQPVKHWNWKQPLYYDEYPVGVFARPSVRSIRRVDKSNFRFYPAKHTAVDNLKLRHHC